MLQMVCQWLMVVQVVLQFMMVTHGDFHGRKASDPKGFAGFVGTLVSCGLIAALWYGAGAFDVIFSDQPLSPAK